MGRPVVRWEIAASDSQRLQDFYTKLFGWQVDSNNPMNYGMVQTGSDEGIDGGIYQVQPGDRTGVTFYVSVDDLKGTLSKTEKLGGVTESQPTSMPVGAFAMFRDPHGNVVGLLEG